MSFTSPAVLLALLSLPLVLYWLGRRGPLEVHPWPSMRFLKDPGPNASERRGLTLPPPWVLATLVSIACLVLALAGPERKRTRAPARLRVFFDVSPSMAWREASGRERWRTGLQELWPELQRLPGETRIAWHTLPDLEFAFERERKDLTLAFLERVSAPGPRSSGPPSSPLPSAPGERILVVSDRRPTWLPERALFRQVGEGSGTNVGIVSAEEERNELWLVVHVAGESRRTVWIEDDEGRSRTERVVLEPGNFHAFTLSYLSREGQGYRVRTDSPDALALDDRVQRHSNVSLRYRLAVEDATVARALRALPGFLRAAEGEAFDVLVAREGTSEIFAGPRVLLEAGEGSFRPGRLVAGDVPDEAIFDALPPLTLATRAPTREGARVLFAARFDNGELEPVVTLTDTVLRLGLSLADLEAARGRYHVPLLFALSMEALRARIVRPALEPGFVETRGGERVACNVLDVEETIAGTSGDDEGELVVEATTIFERDRSLERYLLQAAFLAWLLGPCLRLAKGLRSRRARRGAGFAIKGSA